MPENPVLVGPPSVLTRVERIDSRLRFSQIDAVTAAEDGKGGRFDILGAGVLYAASTSQGAFAETTAAFRKSASLLEKMARVGGTKEDLTGPSLDGSWRESRILRHLGTRDALPFVDIEAAETHTYLTRHARATLIDRNVPMLDVPTVRGLSRLLTRDLSAFLYQAKDGDGAPRFGGIRYLSRYGSEYECWAIFDVTPVELIGEQQIMIDNPDLVAVTQRHDITLA